MNRNEEKYLRFWRENHESVRPCDVVVRGVKLTLAERVFNPDPAITHSSSIVVGHIPDVDGKKVMDLGVGSGILSVYCAFKGAKGVLATDICDAALQNADLNISKHGMEERVTVRRSFLFREVRERFDIILANLPILTDQSQANVYDELLSELPKHLTIGGMLCVTQASFGSPDDLEAKVKAHSYEFEKVSTSKLGVTWHLFRVSI